MFAAVYQFLFIKNDMMMMNFIFLALAYEGGRPVLSLAIQQCMVGVLIVAEFVRGAGGAEISTQIS